MRIPIRHSSATRAFLYFYANTIVKLRKKCLVGHRFDCHTYAVNRRKCVTTGVETYLENYLDKIINYLLSYLDKNKIGYMVS